jgi:hypothetical protein
LAEKPGRLSGPCKGREKRLKQIDQEKTRILSLFQKGFFEMETLEAQVTKLTGEASAIQRRLRSYDEQENLRRNSDKSVALLSPEAGGAARALRQGFLRWREDCRVRGAGSLPPASAHLWGSWLHRRGSGRGHERRHPLGNTFCDRIIQGARISRSGRTQALPDLQ